MAEAEGSKPARLQPFSKKIEKTRKKREKSVDKGTGVWYYT